MVDADIERRFWAKVRKIPDGCWEWQAKTDRGYGRMATSNRKQVPAHRLSYEIAYGPIPDGLIICHRCDNRRCVRPDHLFAGTYKENTADMYAKGRHDPPRGNRQPRSKLNPAMVRDLRARRMNGESINGLARSFGINYRSAYDIVTGKNWAWLDAPAQEV